jgi:hypothetical protein
MSKQIELERGWSWERCRHRLPSALALSLAFKALNLIILAPLAALILRYCLSRWGRASVGNFELVSFLLSPAGIAAPPGVGTILLASLYLELAGMLRLLADDHLRWWQAFRSSRQLFVRIAELGFVSAGCGRPCGLRGALEARHLRRNGVGRGCRPLGRASHPLPLIDDEGNVRPESAGQINRFPESDNSAGSAACT